MILELSHSSNYCEGRAKCTEWPELANVVLKVISLSFYLYTSVLWNILSELEETDSMQLEFLFIAGFLGFSRVRKLLYILHLWLSVSVLYNIV